MDRTRKIAVTIWVLLCLFVLAALDWQFGGLRFVSQPATVIFGLVVIWLPAVCLIMLGFLPRSKTRVLAFVGLILGAPFCIILGGAVVLGLMLSSYTRQASVRLGSSEIVTYFEDAGAWDSGEVFVQQEVKLLPGLLWVKPISKAECLRDVKITVLDRHHVQCDYVADTADATDPNPAAKRDVTWIF